MQHLLKQICCISMLWDFFCPFLQNNARKLQMEILKAECCWANNNKSTKSFCCSPRRLLLKTGYFWSALAATLLFCCRISTCLCRANGLRSVILLRSRGHSTHSLTPVRYVVGERKRKKCQGEECCKQIDRIKNQSNANSWKETKPSQKNKQAEIQLFALNPSIFCFISSFALVSDAALKRLFHSVYSELQHHISAPLPLFFSPLPISLSASTTGVSSVIYTVHPTGVPGLLRTLGPRDRRGFCEVWTEQQDPRTQTQADRDRLSFELFVNVCVRVCEPQMEEGHFHFGL